MPSWNRPGNYSWPGPCYDNQCVQFRAQLEAGVRAEQARWDAEYQAEQAAVQQQLFEQALTQRAAIEAQQFEAEQAAKFLASEQQRVQQEFILEQQKIAEQQKQEQTNVEAQINAARIAAQQEQAAIQLQFETDRASIQEQQTALKTQFETEKAANEKSIAEAAAETAKQQLITKKQTAIQQRSASAENLNRQQIQTTATAPKLGTKRNKTMIGQPGISVTRVSARSGVGGYGGTAPARVNPTGLNI